MKPMVPWEVAFERFRIVIGQQPDGLIDLVVLNVDGRGIGPDEVGV